MATGVTALSVVAATVMAVMTVTVVATLVMMMVALVVVIVITAVAVAPARGGLDRTTAAVTRSPEGWRGSRVRHLVPGDGETDQEGLAAQQSALGPFGPHRTLGRAGRRRRRGGRLGSAGGRTCLPVSRVQLRPDRRPRNEQHGERDEHRDGDGKDEPVTRASSRPR
jgi:hypothetical protein